MKALTFHGVGDVRVESVPDPELLAPGDAIVRVVRTAICGSDLHPYEGREAGLDPGTVLGHEFVGEIVDTGADVATLPVGTLVVSPFSTSCGACPACESALPSRCEHGELFGWVEGGRGLPGAQAELVRVPLAESTLVAVPEGLDPAHALLTGDVLATGHYCADLAEAGRAEMAVVLGCGPVGLAAVLAARELGARRVLAIDRVPERLALAERFGAEPLSLDDDSPVEAILRRTQGRGAEAVLEVVGSPSAARLAFDLVRPGGRIAAVGVHVEPAFAFTPGEAYDKNLTYRAGRCPARRFIVPLLRFARDHSRELDALLTHELPLSEAPAAYELFAARRAGCVKVLLDPRG